MFNPQSFVTQPHNLGKVLQALGVSDGGASLPKRITCPLCTNRRKKSQLILQDPVSGGQWHWCSHCRRSGTLASLFCDVWKVSHEELPGRLESVGLGGALKLFEHDKSETEKQHGLWKAIRPDNWISYLQNSLAGGQLDQLGLARELGTEAWGASIGQVVGHCSKERWMAIPGCNEVSASQLWSGKKRPEKSGVLLPFQDLPGRICAVRSFAPEAGEPYILPLKNCDNQTSLSGGLVYTQQLLQDHTLWDAYVLAIPDPLLALRIIANGLTFSPAPLPIVSWDPQLSVPGYSWACLYGRPLVFWEQHISGGALVQAIATGGEISYSGRGDEKWINDWQTQNPHGLVSEALSKTMPWQEFVEKKCSESADIELRGFVADFLDKGGNIEAVLDVLSATSRKRLQQFVERQNRGRSVLLAGKVITERPDGWFSTTRKGKEELIASAKLKIERVVHFTEIDETWLQGSIDVAQQSVPFAAPEAAVESNTAYFMRKTLAANKCGYPRFGTGWAKSLVEVAQTLHTPIVEQQQSRLGWDPATGSFVFPSYRICNGGQIEPLPIAIPRKNVPHCGCSFAEVTRENLSTLLQGSSEQVEARWTAITILATHLLSAAHGVAPVSIAAVDNRTLQIYTQTLYGCGCLFGEATAKTKLEQLLHSARDDDWTVFAPRALPAVAEGVGLLSAGGLPLLCGISKLEALSYQTAPGWFVLPYEHDVRTVTESTPELTAALQTIIPGYLQFVAKRGWQLPEKPNLFSVVATDIREFVASCFADTDKLDSLPAVFSELDNPERVSDAFLQQLQTLIGKRKLQVLPTGFFAENALQTSDSAVMIPRQAVTEAFLEKYGHGVPSFNYLKQCLPPGENTLSDADYIAVSLSWWDKNMRQGAKANTGKYAVTSHPS